MKYCIGRIEESLIIRREEKNGLYVVGAMYDIETGEVYFLD